MIFASSHITWVWMTIGALSPARDAVTDTPFQFSKAGVDEHLELDRSQVFFSRLLCLHLQSIGCTRGKHLYGVSHLHGHPAGRDACHQTHCPKGVAGLSGIPVAQTQRADRGAPP